MFKQKHELNIRIILLREAKMTYPYPKCIHSKHVGPKIWKDHLFKNMLILHLMSVSAQEIFTSAKFNLHNKKYIIITSYRLQNVIN